MFSKIFRNTRLLCYLLFRKDRIKISVWLLSLLVISLSSAIAYPSIYTSEQDILAFALMMENPAMVAMVGPGYMLEDYTTATIFAHELLLFTAIAVAVMNILFVGRATRADEEDGQLELVRSLPVGRLAYLSAAMIEAIVVNLALALLMGIGLLALRLDGMDLESCFLYGAILGATGFIFASLTATFAQLAETSRGGTAFSFSALAIAYILRAIGDVNAETLSYVSPLGWTVRTDVFASNVWWPVILSIGFGILFVVTAYLLNSIRDMGAGFIPARRGKSHASALLTTPIGFVFSQQKLIILSWAIGITLISASYGSIMGDLETYFADMEIIQAILANDPNLSLTEQFLSLILLIISLFAAIPAVMVLLRLYGEEKHHRIEHFYARAVARTTMFWTYFFASLIVTIVMQLLIAFGLWSAGVSMMEENISIVTLVSASLAYLPSMWVIVALTALLVGAYPKARNFIWGYVVFCFLIAYFKDLWNLPNWLSVFSSFEHAPNLLNDSMKWLTSLLLLFLTSILFSIGYMGYRRRDIG